MSLVQKSLIDVLNRRFVNCHYNSFPGPGWDEDAAALADKIQQSGKSLNYGAILTPDGELVVSFGFDIDEFHHALKSALAQHPEYAGMSRDESAIIQRAHKRPDNVDAQFDAADLYTQVLQFDKANAILDRLRAGKLSPGDASRAHFLKGHYALIDLDNHDKNIVRTEYARIKDAPPELADDIAMDLIELDVELTPGDGFFTGWRFKPGSDLPAIRRRLEQWIKDAPDSNRIGQMYFLLGLARINDGDKSGANEVWEEHFNDYPQDRFAMLSRMHHTDYQFSPYGNSLIIRTQIGGDNPGAAQFLKNMRTAGNGQTGVMSKIIIQGGENLDEATRKRIIAQIEQQLSDRLKGRLESKSDTPRGEKSTDPKGRKGGGKKSGKDDDKP